MRALVRYITRKSRGGVAVRDEVVDAEPLTVGRGNDCGIHLPDPRVLLHHAEFQHKGGELYVSAEATADLRVNDNMTNSAKLAVGDKVRVGPYEIAVQEPEGGLDITLGVELTTALGDDLEKLVARSQIQMTRVGLTMRWWVWLLTGGVLAATFLVPFIFNLLAGPPPDARTIAPGKQTFNAAPTAIWTAGTISAVHKFFGESCETCHETPFVSVRDQACLKCHDGIQNHADTKQFPLTDLTGKTCVSCHKEHQGTKTITLASQDFCADCHGNLDKRTDHTKLHNATDFTANHPSFRPTVIKDSDLRLFDRSRALNDKPSPEENSGLKFPHQKHLRRDGVKDPVKGIVSLQCNSCHVQDDTGVFMLPISFEKNCHSCHTLKFDEFLPGRELIHGKPGQVFQQVRDLYKALAMTGGYQEPEAPAAMRRRPGEPLKPEEKKAVGDWADAKTAALLNGRFGRGLCDECHHTLEMTPTTANGGQNWTVAGVIVTMWWLPKSKFSHASHRDVNCKSCHAAETSLEASEVLLPDIKLCQSCHGGEQAHDRLPSTCVMCHRFHKPGMTEMHQSTAPQGSQRLLVPTLAPAAGKPGATK